ncbi:endolytic transglycosylase MltG [Hydrogenimonas thermophila]|uniref:endolytic transglycosylase MltG n=1 Tax=Hydrogenimonas thermophila TaxID=223786 RepID=UPI000B818B16|nr:endolytic transglycosylase MltG [Hydrogenimonas thermophila]WOE68881.1 endolytic transglycosylase MltG [Hydrogenimonas thermophila]WOE71389.1 endolytic transglycosylase MltG [Hydrogenimonas thermophila]
MSKNILRIVEWSIFVVVVIILSLCFYLTQPVKTSLVLFLPSGSQTAIISYLHKNGIDLNLLDKYLLRFFGYPQQGWIEIGTTRLTKADLLYKITHAKAAIVKVTLVPGETSELFISQLAKKLGLDKRKLFVAYKKYAPYMDGVIWPDTYYIPMGISEEHLMNYLISKSIERHKRLAKKIFGVYNETKWFRYVTIASIIQKEAANKDEMPIISAVIYNRLRKHMRLQMDGTLNYGKYSHIKVTKRRIKSDKSHFNTYKYKGLPPTPVGSVSLYALKAAIKPANVNYLYFVKGKNGRHIFTKSYKSHLKALKSVNK